MQTKAIGILLAILFIGGGYVIYTKAQYQAEVAGIRAELTRTAAAGSFTAAMLEGLPPAARRYLSHAIAEGAPLAGYALLKMEGSMRLDPDSKWLPMEADQVISVPHGFVWQAEVGEGGLDFTGGDLYYGGEGNVRFWLSNIIPVVNATGPDVARSARGRLAFESVWHPAALLPENGAQWEGLGPDRARVTVTIDGIPHKITFEIDQSGAPLRVTGERWGDKARGEGWRLMDFGAEFFEEKTFDGYTIPTKVTVAWDIGNKNEFPFFRAEITDASYPDGSPSRQVTGQLR